MNYLPFAIFYGIIPIMILGGLGMLFETIAAVKANRGFSLGGQTILHIPFNVLISLPGVVIYIFFFRNLYEVSDDWRRFYLDSEEPLLHFNITLAPPIDWLGLGIAILSYTAAVLLIGARMWSKLWPGRKAVLDGEIDAYLESGKSFRELYPGGYGGTPYPGLKNPLDNPSEWPRRPPGSQRGHKP